jgi:hypothetical protein
MFFCYAQPYGDGVLFKQALVAAAWCGFRLQFWGGTSPTTSRTRCSTHGHEVHAGWQCVMRGGAPADDGSRAHGDLDAGTHRKGDGRLADQLLTRNPESPASHR